MRICKNTSCNKEFDPLNGKQYYCNVKCQIKFNGEICRIATRNAIFEFEHPEMVRWVRVFQNSSIDAIRQLIDLPPLEIKEANRYIDLIEY